MAFELNEDSSFCFLKQFEDSISHSIIEEGRHTEKAFGEYEYFLHHHLEFQRNTKEDAGEVSDGVQEHRDIADSDVAAHTDVFEVVRLFDIAVTFIALPAGKINLHNAIQLLAVAEGDFEAGQQQHRFSAKAFDHQQGEPLLWRIGQGNCDRSEFQFQELLFSIGDGGDVSGVRQPDMTQDVAGLHLCCGVALDMQVAVHFQARDEL